MKEAFDCFGQSGNKKRHIRICFETGKYAPSIDTLQKLSEVLGVKPWEFYYFNDLTEDEMKQEIIKALDNNQKLLKIMYNFYKSIEV